MYFLKTKTISLWFYILSSSNNSSWANQKRDFWNAYISEDAYSAYALWSVCQSDKLDHWSLSRSLHVIDNTTISGLCCRILAILTSQREMSSQARSLALWWTTEESSGWRRHQSPPLGSWDTQERERQRRRRRRRRGGRRKTTKSLWGTITWPTVSHLVVCLCLIQTLIYTYCNKLARTIQMSSLWWIKLNLVITTIPNRHHIIFSGNVKAKV